MPFSYIYKSYYFLNIPNGLPTGKKVPPKWVFKTVAPNVLLCFKSFLHANNWAVAPKNISHGKTKDTPEVNPSFWY